MGVAKIIVDVRTRSLDEPFDYAIPTVFDDAVDVGVPVLVPLGPRQVVGYVVERVQSSGVRTLKPVSAVLGPPLFDSGGWQLARWIAEEYVCPVSEAVRLLLPPGGAPEVTRVGSGADAVWALKRPAVAATSRTIVELVDPDPTLASTARMQRAIVDALRGGPVSTAELGAELGAVHGAIRALETRDIVRLTERRRWRGVATGSAASSEAHTLSDAQRAAVQGIASAAPGTTCVLEGVTGSGKTEVYLTAIEAVLRDGGGAIVLVPEISLTPQTVGRFRARFGNRVAVLHSRLSAGERFDQWELAARGEASVVVGARSALFAPVRHLRLIVIDEEHEPSYKQGSSPRYHARDVAVRLAALRGATLVLGSATPSMEARVAVEGGEFKGIMLPERVGAAVMPAVQIVDMGSEFAHGNKTVFSRDLAASLDDVVATERRAVLFLNRRGFASFLLCRECGFVPSCPSCSVSLTYHDRAETLTCHHCGHSEAVPVSCPRCGSPYLRRFGAGTERIEQELAARWPGLTVVRMDADTTRGKGGHERALSAFESARPGVLLGTQMIAKGLDYPDITLVGVLAADLSLRVPDFRAAERTYQLLEQVAGRAGRGRERGRVVVQTYWPDHAAVRAVALRQPALVYERERAERAQLGYPPYGRLANLVLSGPTRMDVVRAADALARALRPALPERWSLLGPADPAIAKLKGAYRRHLLVKCPPDARPGPLIRAVLGQVTVPADVNLIIDVDPVDLT